MPREPIAAGEMEHGRREPPLVLAEQVERRWQAATAIAKFDEKLPCGA
jgi:hypothetical protein